MDDAMDVEPYPTADSRTGGRLAWFVVGILAVIVFELTADPSLALALGCLKFGWDDLATSRWLRRTDPDSIRGKICSRFYASWALWRVAVVAFCFMFLISTVHGYLNEVRRKGMQVQAGPPPTVFISAAATAMVGFLVSGAVSNLAIISALWRGISVWVGPEAGRARRSGQWPPSLESSPTSGTNQIRRIILGTIITNLVLIGVPSIAVVVGLFQEGVLPRPSHEVGFAMIACSIVLVAVAVCWMQSFFDRRIVAETPHQCWPPEAATPEFAERD